jgi:tRNA(Phe) wybutosine-synthesizing methylase Tyw3
MNNHLREADEAMDRFSKKLEKENKKYAKQKQSKR